MLQSIISLNIPQSFSFSSLC